VILENRMIMITIRILQTAPQGAVFRFPVHN